MTLAEHIYEGRYSDEDIDLLCRRALAKWSLPTQILMCVEELAEFIQVLVKSGRKVNSSTKEEIASEMADAKLMLRQMQIAFGINDITLAAIEEKKLHRLKILLETTQ